MTDKKLLAIILSIFFAIWLCISIMCPWGALLPFKKEFFEVFPEYNVDISEVECIEYAVETSGWGEKDVRILTEDQTTEFMTNLSKVKVERNWIRSIQCLFMGDDYLENGSYCYTLFLKDGRELKLYVDVEHGGHIQRINDSCYYCVDVKIIQWRLFNW